MKNINDLIGLKRVCGSEPLKSSVMVTYDSYKESNQRIYQKGLEF